MRKWTNAQLQNTPDIDFQGGICRCMASVSTHLNSDPGTDIASNMKKNRTIHIQCIN